jgi:hypothetical protein
MYIFVRRTCVGPSCLARVQEPSARGRSNCEVGVARVAPRVLNRVVSVCVWNEVVVLDTFSFLVLRSPFTFLIALI